VVIAKEGKKIIYFLLVFNLLAILLWASNVINYSILILMIGALLFCLNFFRDPKRIPPDGSNLIISPADGKVIRVDIIDDEKLGEVYAISIFLNIFNVHVNRMPLNGSILDIKYNEGKFLLAFNHKACDENERNTIELMTEIGRVRIIQITGLLARRIICYANKGQNMLMGERLGFMLFGSRIDLMIPSSIKIKIKPGQKVIGNQSIIGTY
tara:strand:+ start:5993 stop:6625 length:633 start_codon:yes stop_codon:yes gene_type:complete